MPDKALVLIDIQKGFNSPVWGGTNQPEFENNVELLLGGFRRAGLPVIHVQHLSLRRSSPLAPGQEGVDFMECAAPRFGERIFQKHVNSAFIGTNLEAYLRSAGIKKIVIVGISTDHCVSTTARMAGNLGFEVEVVADATRAFDRKDHTGKIFTADLVHQVSLASLHGEFATVLTTRALLDNMGKETNLENLGKAVPHDLTA